MKFDVIIGNPPYQLETSGFGRQAKPIYNLFVERAKDLNPKYLTMIIPSRWFSGGMGLEQFRNSMLEDKRLSNLIDFTNSKECFSGVSISGGVCYFLWQRDYNGPCKFKNIHNGKVTEISRELNEFDIFVRYNEAIGIIRKINKISDNFLSKKVLSINYFSLSSSERGTNNKTSDSAVLFHSQGNSFINKKNISNVDALNKYKVVVSRTISEHAGEPGKNGNFKVIAKCMTLKPNEVCTHSYLVVGLFDNINEANNLKTYLNTKFVRFLILIAISGIDLSKARFRFVPLQDFQESFSDNELYKKYSLGTDEIEFIESMMRSME